MKYFKLVFLLFGLAFLSNEQSESKPLLVGKIFYVDSLSTINRNKYTNCSTDRRQPPEEVLSVRFGFRAGMNSSNMNFNRGYPPPVVPVETSWRTGLHLGFTMEVPLYDKAFIQPEYLYSQLGGKIASSEIAYKLHYVSLPVLLKYKLTTRLSIVAGPQFDLLIWAKAYNNGISSDITHDVEERNVSAVAGIEFQLIKQISLGARYVHGVNHVGIEEPSVTKEFKYELIQLTADLKLYDRYFHK